MFVDAGSRLESITGIGQNILLAGLIAGLVMLFLTDRYLVAYLVRPLNDLRDHFRSLPTAAWENRFWISAKLRGPAVPAVARYANQSG